jgi:predicted O-linked N-acetylglucosamine transferase (SPINDLY family)
MPHDDAQRSLSDHSFNRSEFGLPKDAIVFSCFNNAYKLNPYIFEAWMRILAKVPESVIWLSHTNRTAIANLKAEAPMLE